MLKKNQATINRSQNLSMEFGSFNEEQVQVLKEQNLFLTNENEKLTKTC